MTPMSIWRILLPGFALTAVVGTIGGLVINLADPSGPVAGMLFVILAAVAGLIGGRSADRLPEHRT